MKHKIYHCSKKMYQIGFTTNDYCGGGGGKSIINGIKISHILNPHL